MSLKSLWTPLDSSCALQHPKPWPLSQSCHDQWTPKHCKSMHRTQYCTSAIHYNQSLSDMTLYLSKTSESSAALITHPIRGTPANNLMFFRGMPLLPPRARIRAAMCLNLLRFVVELSTRPSCCRGRLPFFFTSVVIFVANQLVFPSRTDN